jgi:histidyl-tRNA synthetase
MAKKKILVRSKRREEEDKNQQTVLELKATPLRRKDRFQRPRGMHDVLPEDWQYMDYVFRTAESVWRSHEFEHIDVPIAENVDLFARAIGEGTDIVEKEMFLLKDRGGDRLALRPEFTAGLVRAYIENGLNSRPQPVKVYAYGPLFRAERPQAGRYRQFHQVDFEIFGGSKPSLDVQVIQLTWRILERLGLKNLTVQINSIGCSECRPLYRQTLLDYYRPHGQKLCADCKKRIKRNPLRLLDCKEEKCQRLALNAPQMFDSLCEACHDHFKQVLETLDELDIPYILNSRLVRGLDYYSRTVFEVWPETKGGELAQSSLGGGGRYDGLVELMGGQPTPAVGVALGVERLVEEMKRQNIKAPPAPAPRVFLAQLGEKAKKYSFRLFEDLYATGIDVIESFGRDSLKSQLKQAEKKAVLFTLILGQKEAVDNTIIVRDMATGVQEVISQEQMIKYLKHRLQEKENGSTTISAGQRTVSSGKKKNK